MPAAGRKRKARDGAHVEIDFDGADPVQAIVDRIMDDPRTQSVIGVVDQFGQAIDRMSQRGRSDPIRAMRSESELFRWKQRCLELEERWKAANRAIAQLRQKLEQVKRPVRSEDPRAVLLFPTDAAPSPAQVRSRRNALAAIVHPDRGGSTEVMQRINRAADELLASRK